MYRATFDANFISALQSVAGKLPAGSLRSPEKSTQTIQPLL
jgi:hypothetical protein